MKKRGIIFCSGLGLAVLAFVCLAPVYNPPSSTGGVWGAITGTLSAQSDLATALGLKAPLASPALTGNPTAPTQTDGNNSTRLATTAYADVKQTAAQVQALIDAAAAALPITTSGMYTPTAQADTNLDAITVYPCQWSRVGNVVTVSGKIDADATLIATASRIKAFLLPVSAQVFANDYEAGGTAVSEAIAGQSAAIKAQTGQDTAEFNWISVNTANQSMYFSFTYQIIP